MTPEMDQGQIVSAVKAAAGEVFSAMLQLPLKAGEPRQDGADGSGFDGVLALVGVAGSWTGSARISCSPALACKLAGALLKSPCEAVNEAVLDAVAEVANMIVGNVKTILEERVGPLGLSAPTVIFGHDYRTRSSRVTVWTVVPFRCGEEVMEVRFCLMPTRPLPIERSTGSSFRAEQANATRV